MTRNQYLINPFTGRKIKKNGPTHKKLKELEMERPYELSKRKRQHAGSPSESSATASAPVSSQTAQAKESKSNSNSNSSSNAKAQAQTQERDEPITRKDSDKFYEDLIKLTNNSKPDPAKLTTSDNGDITIPKNKFSLIPSNLPPAPPGSHSYYHHHAPFSQDFGDYVCLKKDTLRDISMFLRDSML